MKKLTDLSLPAFAFLDDPTLRGRNVILHVRSASVVEILEEDSVLALDENAIRYHFVYDGPAAPERMVAVLHHAPLLEASDPEEIVDIVLRPAAEYYMEDCRRLDSENISGIIADAN